MTKTIISLVSLTVLASMAAALDTGTSSDSAQLTHSKVSYCTQTNWQGTCQLSIIQDAGSQNVLSIGSNEGRTCFLMQDQCNAEEPYTDISYPGYGDLSTANLEWYQFADSIFCE
ncbi:hypothetical protein LTR85_000219 [Meristemomyces frigidus]|nr:hypothetical protein LTR85_000219 [Meristemomyces frigidus]